MQRAVYEYISKKTTDPIIAWNTCPASGDEFAIYQSDHDFLEKVTPVVADKKYTIPYPQFSPTERLRRRLAWRNNRTLYKGSCAATGKSLISMYPSDSPYTIYDQKVRR